MRWIQAILREVLGLFLDDGILAAGVIVWLAFAILALWRLPISGQWKGPLFLAGLLLILFVSVLHFVRTKRK